LSTGINPHAFPLPQIENSLWTYLPDKGLQQAVEAAAAAAYHTTRPCLALAGAQQAIQLYPALFARYITGRKARLLHPSYNEHERQLIRHNWQVERVCSIDQLAGADLVVVVNPNNPDGRYSHPEKLLSLSERVRVLVIDESFCDPLPHLSVCPHLTAQHENILVLRSFGKFYGLAGLRLGFAVGTRPHLDDLAEMMGSWAVSGPALAVGWSALTDRIWTRQMTTQLATESVQLDKLAIEAGWQIVGGTSLYRLYQMDDAAASQDHLAKHQIWVRAFSYNENWLRLGLPPQTGWARLEKALRG
jgi:cobalamin biosynthetic protein CobC